MTDGGYAARIRVFQIVDYIPTLETLKLWWWYFVGMFLKVCELKKSFGGSNFISGQLLALDNSEARVLDKLPKDPLSFG